MDKELIFCKRW